MNSPVSPKRSSISPKRPQLSPQLTTQFPPKSPRRSSGAIQPSSDLESEVSLISAKFGDSSTYDHFNLVVVLLPSFLAVLFPNENWNFQKFPALVADLTMLMLIAWIVKFVTTWPTSWVQHLSESREKLLNYVNSIKISLGDPPVAEITLNRQVFLSNLLLAQKLKKLENYGWILGLLSAGTGASLMVWARGHILVVQERERLVFNDVNIGMFMIWSLFKLVLLYSSKMEAVTGFGGNAVSTSEFVTESNLDLYVSLFDGAKKDFLHPEPARNPASPKKPGKSKLLVEIDTLKKDVQALRNSMIPEISKRPVFSPKEVFVSVTPFPLNGSPTLSFHREPPKKLLPSIAERRKYLPPIAEEPLHFIEPTPKLNVLPEPRPPFVVSYDSEKKYSIHGAPFSGSVEGFLTRLIFRKKHMDDFSQKDYAPYTMAPSQHPDIESWFDPMIEFFAQLKDYALNPSKTTPRELLDALHATISRSKEKLYDILWEVFQSIFMLNFDFYSGVFGAVHRILFAPARTALRLCYIAMVKIPINMARLYISVLLFLPKVLFKVLVVAPASLFKEYFKDPETNGYKEYRLTHQIPLLREGTTTQTFKKLLVYLNPEEATEY